jgi:hypothetical protein
MPQRAFCLQVGISAPKLVQPRLPPSSSSSGSSSSSTVAAGASVDAAARADRKSQLQVPAPISRHSGYAAVAARSAEILNFPNVELSLGTRGETVNFTPSQSWGMADLLTNVTTLRQRFGLTGKGIKIGIIDR